jgi:AcrR family transcriptional regulator
MDAADVGGTRRAGTRRGRAPLLDAALELLLELHLEDVMARVGVRSVAARAGVAPGTVNHHFRSTGSAGSPNRTLATATLAHAIGRSPDIAASTSRQLIQHAAGDRSESPSRRGVAEVARDDYLANAGLESEAETVAMLLACAVAPRDAQAAETLRDCYETLSASYAAAYVALAEGCGRRFVDGISAEHVAAMVTALADGVMLRARFDPATATEDLFTDAAIRLFLACTASIDGDA